ncbi:uncharacterized protein [Anoplolepis gracilipes]|uniref:uncharacterized protein n=1 Tax=Anoplolepis gracilipes TaxID=354296 RepID=UPI003B9EA408
MSSRSASSDTAIHAKLEPPRSLDGVEDAEIIWDTITRRFPQAAPLLCEMETVIERAEDLLQQLKTPCAQENDTSNSFHTALFPDSQDSNTTMSDIEFVLAEETNVLEQPEIPENVEMQLTTQDIDEKQIDLSQHHSEQSNQCEEKYPDQRYHLNSPPRVDKVVQHFETSSMNKCQNSQGESDTNVTNSSDKGINVSSEEKLVGTIEEKNSLEGWTKIADNALREWHEDTENIDIYDNESEIQPNINIDNCLLMINKRDETDAYKLQKPDDAKIINNNLQDITAKCSVTITIPRSPLTILEEYAKRCNVSIKYEYKPKPNMYVINGDLCGFRAMSCAATKDLAKNELAAKILWMVAERQMDDSKLSSFICGLSDFSREEMLEIIVFHQGELKNASQKLYKFCLEKGEPTPEYSIRKLRTTKGFMYEAECVALGRVGIGQGSRKDTAKITAAENLYQKYIQEAEQQTM